MRQPHFLGPVICSSCYRAIWHPRWALVDYDFRQSFCWPCYHQRQAEFTADNAISQASVIVRSARSAVAR